MSRDTSRDRLSSIPMHPENKRDGSLHSPRPASPRSSRDFATMPGDFATGADFIAFDFSDNEELEGGTTKSPGKSKGKERSDAGGRDRRNVVKRAPTEMEAEYPGHSNGNLHIDAGLGLTPWMENVDMDSCHNIAEMMHKEVQAFVDYISPTPEEHEVRRMLIAIITRAIRSAWPDAEVLSFGSFETKLYLPRGDIDLVIVSRSIDRQEPRRILYHLAQILRKTNITSKVTVIAKARVPIVKFVTTHGRLAVDISLNHSGGVVAGRIVNRFLHELPALRPLVVVIKLFLKQRGMNEVYTGGLGSFAIVCMAISFLQMHPKIRSGEIDPSANLGVLLMEFFELYGLYFNYENTGISIRDGGTYFNKKDRGWLDFGRKSLLSIEDPNDISNDIARNSYKIARVRLSLAGAHEILKTTALIRSRIMMAKAHGQYTRLRPHNSRDQQYDNPSILGSILRVTQETIDHRWMVRYLYEKSTLQTLLGLAPYRPPTAIFVRETSLSRPTTEPLRSRSAQAVENAWGEADMDVSSEEELVRKRVQSPEAEEESRYSILRARKRRRLGKNAIYVSGSEEEDAIAQHIYHGVRPDEEHNWSAVKDARIDKRRAYWASKGMGERGLDDSD